MIIHVTAKGTAITTEATIIAATIKHTRSIGDKLVSFNSLISVIETSISDVTKEPDEALIFNMYSFITS
jgi:hypothetical protein